MAEGLIPGTTRSEEEVERANVLRQFRDFFGADLDELVTQAWQQGFQAGVAAEEKRRHYIEDVLAELKAKRGF